MLIPVSEQQHLAHLLESHGRRVRFEVLSSMYGHDAFLKEVAALAPEQTWFQLYAMRDWAIVEDLLRRARTAGIEVLVVTVDLPVHGHVSFDACGPETLTYGELNRRVTGGAES